MRLIRAAAAGSVRDIRLFGSRGDDSAQGGDVDLYVEVEGLDVTQAAALQRYLRPRLEDAIDLPVDLVVQQTEKAPMLVSTVARETGISLLDAGRE